ncbi:MAG: ABC transporter ATP-binding protein [Candidatus Omnitrophica bacterium]|nr:ABC transporter ATP-binding protein [Candidatus Omnitrophota bacterium]
MIELKNISKSLGKNKILEDISFSIKKADKLVILGPSGSGKTTILRLIAGFEAPDQGQILFDGENMNQIVPSKRGVSMVFQDLALWPHMSVTENIAFCLKAKDSKAKIAEMLNTVGLEHKAKAYPQQLSGGEKQRLALARSLVFSPKILLLDEPLSSMDPLLKDDLKKLILDLQKKTRITMIYVTHDQAEAAQIAEQVILLHQGKIEQKGTLEEIRSNPNNLFVKKFMGVK